MERNDTVRDKEHPVYPGKVGIFGGCFDPVHIGHLDLINTFRSQTNIQKIIILPACQPVHKPDITASYEDRIEMCRLAVGDDAGLEVDDAERRLGANKYFCNILRHFRTFLKDIYLIMGPDTYLSLGYWKDSAYIIKNATLCTVLPKKDTGLLNHSEYFRKMGGHTVFIDHVPLDISSSSIRADIQSAQGLLPPEVYRYILQNGLYSCNSDRPFFDFGR